MANPHSTHRNFPPLSIIYISADEINNPVSGFYLDLYRSTEERATAVRAPAIGGVSSVQALLQVLKFEAPEWHVLIIP